MGFLGFLLEFFQRFFEIILWYSWIFFHGLMAMLIHKNSKDMMPLGGGLIFSCTYIWNILFVTKIFLPDIVPDWFHSDRLFILFVKVLPLLAKRTDFCNRLHLHNVLKNEDKSPSVDLVAALVAANPAGVHQKDYLGNTPVDIAIRRETNRPNTFPKEVWEILFCAAPNYLRQKQGHYFDRLPLHVAMKGNLVSLNLVNALIEKYPEGLQQRDCFKETPMDLAIDKEVRKPNSISKEVFEILFSAAPNYPRQKLEKWNQYPLSYIFPSSFAKRGPCPTNLILFLVKLNPMAAQKRICGLLPIHEVCMFQDTPKVVIDALLKAHPRGAEETGFDSQLPIHIACKHGTPAGAVTALIKAMPKGVAQRDYNNLLPIHYCIQRRQPNLYVIGALIEASPPCLLLEKVGVNSKKNKNGAAPTLLEAICRRHGSIVDNNNKSIATVRYVLAFVAHKAICKLREAPCNKNDDGDNIACNILFHTLQLDPTIIHGQAD